MNYGDDKNFMVQRDKYRSRSEKFLIAGALGAIATLGLIAVAPAIVTVPVLATSLAMNSSALAGFAANKIAENTTDSFEPLTKREKFINAISFLRKKVFGNTNNHKLEL